MFGSAFVTRTKSILEALFQVSESFDLSFLQVKFSSRFCRSLGAPGKLANTKAASFCAETCAWPCFQESLRTLRGCRFQTADFGN